MNHTKVVFSWLIFGFLLVVSPAWSIELYVAPSGSDANPGTKSKPLATIKKARDTVRLLSNTEAVTVYLRSGTYELIKPIVFTESDSGTAQALVTYCAYPGEQIVISGGQKLSLQWTPWRNGIMQAKVASATPVDQLFINGTRQHIARWPNPEPRSEAYSQGLKPVEGEPFSKVTPQLRGYAAFVFDPVKFSEKKWAHPEMAVIHVMQSKLWSNMQWKIRSINYETHTITLGQGGWQIGTLWEQERANEVEDNSKFFIENVLEELDSPD